MSDRAGARPGGRVSRCKGCGKDFRKGRRRSLLQTDGTLVSAIVCPACANNCLQVLAPAFYVPPRELVIEGKELLVKIKMTLRTWREQNRRVLEQPDESNREYYKGKVEGLDQAMTLINAALEGRV